MFIFRRFKFIILAIHCLSIFKSSIFWIHNSKFWFCTGFGSWITSIPKVLYVDLISPYSGCARFLYGCLKLWSSSIQINMVSQGSAVWERLFWFLKLQVCRESVTFFAFFTWYMWLLLLLFLHTGEWIKFHLFVMTYSKRTLVVMVRHDGR